MLGLKACPFNCHENREKAMVVSPDGWWCDPCIEPIVRALNTCGLKTIASCCGHGEQPGVVMLADGREVIIARDWNEARRIEGLLIDDILPPCHPEEPPFIVAGDPAEHARPTDIQLTPLHMELLLRGEAGKFIWLSDDMGMRVGEVVALGELKRAGLVREADGPFPPGPAELPPCVLTDAGCEMLGKTEPPI